MELYSVVRQAVEAVLGPMTSPDDDFMDVGADSLQLLEIAARLSDSLGQAITIVDVVSNPSVEILTNHIAGTLR